MKIYIDSENEIKAINNTSDSTLTEIEVNRDDVFPGLTDIAILNYKYIHKENGYSITPVISTQEIEKLELQQRISDLETYILTNEGVI